MASAGSASAGSASSNSVSKPFLDSRIHDDWTSENTPLDLINTKLSSPESQDNYASYA